MEENTIISIDLGMLIEAIQSGNWTVIFVVLIPVVITVATAITMFIPSTAEHPAMKFILATLKLFAGNILANTNADDPNI